MIGNNIIENYTFDKVAKTITLTDFDTLSLNKLLIVIDMTNQTVIYQPNVQSKGATISGNVITLEFETNTVDFNNTDSLHIVYHDGTVGESHNFAPGYGVRLNRREKFHFDINENLKTRSGVFTDESSFRSNFANSSLEVSIGTCTFTNGSNIVTGTGFASSSLKSGNYVKLNSDSYTAWVQVDYFTDTEIYLEDNYTGTGGTGASSHAKMRPFITNDGSITVSSGQAIINGGTSVGSTILSRNVDYLPLNAPIRLSISQRIANQTIRIGFAEEVSPAKWFARFVCDGTDNRIIKTESGYNPTSAPSVNEIETTTFNLNTFNIQLTTNSLIDYEIQVNLNQINFLINGVIIATHTKSIPDVDSVMGCGIAVINSSTVTSTTVSVDYVMCKNHNVVEQTVWNKEQIIPIKNSIPINSDRAVVVSNIPQKLFRTSFASVQSGVDSRFFTSIITGAGQTVNQSGGNLVITSGTTANSETILRSIDVFRGNMRLFWQNLLSQRIINNNFIIELVDVIGDGLSVTVNSATSITVTIPNNPFNSTNVGQSISIGSFTGISGAIGGRYAIASVSGNNVTFTVAGFPVSGSGTCSLFGWNTVFNQYSGTTATNATYGTRRRGWTSIADTTITVPTTASPGYMGQFNVEEGSSTISDRLTASASTTSFTRRGDRITDIPDTELNLYIQIRVLNGSTAPASNTTWTIGTIGLENYNAIQSTINGIKLNSYVTLPVAIAGTPSVAQSGNWSTRTQSGAGTSIGSGFDTSPGLNASLSSANVTDIASAAITTTANSATISSSHNCFIINIIVTIVSGTNPTMDVVVQESIDGTNWVDVYHFERITTTGNYISPVINSISRKYRLVQTIGGTTPSFTRSVQRISKSVDGLHIRNFFNRTINVNSLGSTTPSFFVVGSEKVSLLLSMGAGGTMPTIQIQTSQDGTNWTNEGSTLLGVDSSTVKTILTSFGFKFVRAIVTSAGSGSTLNYVNIQTQ